MSYHISPAPNKAPWTQASKIKCFENNPLSWPASFFLLHTTHLNAQSDSEFGRYGAAIDYLEVSKFT